jgi:hypothetical protein
MWNPVTVYRHIAAGDVPTIRLGHGGRAPR